MKVNKGWLRIGVVLSLLWIAGSTILLWKKEVKDEDLTAHYSYEQCASDSDKRADEIIKKYPGKQPTPPDYLPDFSNMPDKDLNFIVNRYDECAEKQRQLITELKNGSVNKLFFVELFSCFIPLCIAWALSLGMVRVFRWVRAGFQQG